MLTLVLERLRLARWDEAADRHVLSAFAMVILSIAGACLTGLLAQLRIYLLFTPVPVTGQVLAVLICGGFLGGGYGLLSQVIYVGLGAAGLPWFADGTGGVAALIGPSGGYLLGFVMAAYFLGAATKRSAEARALEGQMMLMLIAVGIIYFFGVLHQMLVLGWSPLQAILLGAAPFIAVDVVKAVMAAMVTSAALPGRSSSAQAD